MAKGKKTGGRKKGTLNKVTVEAQVAAAALVDDPQYREKLLADLRKRRVAPAVEVMLWGYAKGAVPKKLEIGGEVTLAGLLAEAAKQ